MSKESDGPSMGVKEDARIWKLYNSYAKKEDKWISGYLNGNLDVMLIFAGLFSAVVTAFLVESKKLLQPDPAGVSVALLLVIARSQQQIQLDVPPESATPVQLPPFSVPASVVVTNVLWFIALSFSLSAALLALLAKEWLGNYLRHPPHLATDARSQTFAHQEKLRSMTRCWGFEIIDLIPILLHLSLFIFVAGLVVHLWHTCRLAAGCILGIFAGTALIYIVTTVAAAVKPTRPFVTRVSRYIRLLILQFQPDTSNKTKTLRVPDVERAEGPSREITDNGSHHGRSATDTKQSNDTRAIQYLEKPEEDDPRVLPSLLQIYDELGDPVFDPFIEATSAARIRWALEPFQPNPKLMITGSRDMRPVFLRSFDNDRAARIEPKHHRSVQLIRVVIQRLTQIADTRNHRHGSNHNLDPYVEGLANLCTYVSTKSTGWSDWTSDETRSILDDALAVLDNIQHNSQNFLTPNTRATVTGSRFKLLWLITSYLDNLSKGNPDGWINKQGSLRDIANRVVGNYNSAFLRLKAQLAGHSDGTNTIGDTNLLRLLDCVGVATQSLGGMIQVVDSYLSSGYPRPENDTIPGDFGASRELARLAFPISVQSSDRELQYNAQAAFKSVITVISTRRSGSNEIRKYDQSFIGIGLSDESTTDRREEWLRDVLSDLGSQDNTPAEQPSTDQLLTAALLFTSHGDLTLEKLAASEEIIRLLGARTIESDNHWFWRLVKMVRWHGATQKENLCGVQSGLLWIISKMRNDGRTCLRDANNPPDSDELGDIISLLSNLPQTDDTRRDIVERISDNLKPSLNPQAFLLLRSQDGLLSLMLVARNDNYRSCIVDVIFDIVTTAATQQQILHDRAVDGFLAATSYVLNFYESISPNSDRLAQFADGAQRLLGDRSAPPESPERSQVLEYVRNEISPASESIDWSIASIRAKLSGVNSVSNGSSANPGTSV